LNWASLLNWGTSAIGAWPTAIGAWPTAIGAWPTARTTASTASIATASTALLTFWEFELLTLHGVKVFALSRRQHGKSRLFGVFANFGHLFTDFREIEAATSGTGLTTSRTFWLGFSLGTSGSSGSSTFFTFRCGTSATTASCTTGSATTAAVSEQLPHHFGTFCGHVGADFGELLFLLGRYLELLGDHFVIQRVALILLDIEFPEAIGLVRQQDVFDFAVQALLDFRDFSAVSVSSFFVGLSVRTLKGANIVAHILPSCFVLFYLIFAHLDFFLDFLNPHQRGKSGDAAAAAKTTETTASSASATTCASATTWLCASGYRHRDNQTKHRDRKHCST
jgi:hypothetical protein